MAIALRLKSRCFSSIAAVAAKLPDSATAAVAAKFQDPATAAAVAAKLPDSATAAAASAAARPINLVDTERLFAGVSTANIIRSLATLQALTVGPLVDVATVAMRSPAVMGTRFGRAAVAMAARPTVYQQFCAGETTAEAESAVRALWSQGMRGILDYGIEDAEDASACDRNTDGFVAAVDVAAALPATSASVCIKITALCPIALLERMSDLLRWQQKHPSFELPWKAHSFPLLTESSPVFLTDSMPLPLSDEEECGLRLAVERLARICEECAKSNIPLLVDAEYASVQPAIDYFIFLASLQFNKEQPIVYGTIQAYLRDAKEKVVEMVEAAEKEKMNVGIKLVRGAYLSRESQLAASLGVPSPIHGSIQETHDCYNDCASFLLEKASQGSASVMLATHNIESGQLAAAKAQELGIAKEDPKLQFAQLMGMADGLSLGLRNAGFQVSKYLPYGPVDQIMPYLIRRAEENKGFLSTSAPDMRLLRKELMRRVKEAVLG